MQILRKCIAESLAEPLETPFECAWDDTYIPDADLSHTRYCSCTNILVEPDVDLVVTAIASFVCKRLVL